MLYAFPMKWQETTCHEVCYVHTPLKYTLLQNSGSYKFHNFHCNLDPSFKQDNSEYQC